MASIKWLAGVGCGVALWMTAVADAENPVVADGGVCDGHVRIFGDTAYLYSSHDFSAESKNWDMRDWLVWSSPDLIHWTRKFALKPADTYVKPDLKRCFATDGATRNGKYYLYFSEGQASTGVAQSDSPDGPYVDALKRPLVKSVKGFNAYDPTVYVDDDANRTPYFIWGQYTFRIAKLNDDMISLAEPERKIDMVKWARKSDANFLHKKNGLYYLTSNYGHYGTSKDIYGPYTYVGRLTPFGKDDNVDHPTFFTWHGQDYFVGNDTWSIPNNYFRSLRMTYVHYKRDGGIVVDPVVYNSKLGVGQYDAAGGTIEAEWYFKIEGQAKKAERAAGGFGIENIGNNDAMYFPNVTNLAKQTKLSFRAAGVKGGRIEVREETPTGELLSTCVIPAGDGAGADQTYTAAFKSVKDKCNLCLVFRGEAGELFRVDSLVFSGDE